VCHRFLIGLPFFIISVSFCIEFESGCFYCKICFGFVSVSYVRKIVFFLCFIVNRVFKVIYNVIFIFIGIFTLCCLR